VKRNVRVERVYPFPRERVFRALTDPAAVTAWLMPSDFQAKVGHRFQFRAKPQGNWNGIVDCVVTELEAPRRLAYSWSGQSRDGKKPALRSTVVSFTLHEEAGGTRVVLEHTGFSGLGEVLTSFILGAGWKHMMKTRLPAAMADAPVGKVADPTTH
jgi:uncharacterized protein YndB with AHSA1/START domain